MLGDFHLLLPLTVSYHDWCGWQFHRADLDEGYAVLLRRHRSPFPEIEARLRGIAADRTYEVSLSPGYEEAPRRHMAGSELSAMVCRIDAAPGSLLIRYRGVG